MNWADTHADVSGHDATCDGCETSDHNGHEFGSGHRVEVGFYQQGGFGLPDKNIPCSRKGFSTACSERFLHHKRDRTDEFLHRTDVIEDRHKRGEKDDRREDFERHEVDFVGRGVASRSRDFVGAKDESCTLVDAIEQIGKQVADGLEDRLSKIGSQNHEGQSELHQQTT